MKSASRQLPFDKLVHRAFPSECHDSASEAATILSPLLEEYRHRTFRDAVVEGRAVQIPYRVYFKADASAAPPDNEAGVIIHCIRTRSHNGYMRQRALGGILSGYQNVPWVMPFIILLLGEYVVEIAEDIQSSLDTFDHEAYGRFVLENQSTLRVLRDRAASYWNCYYRRAYPKKASYPGLAVLYELERWAVQ